MSPVERETLEKFPSQLNPPAAVRFHGERSPSPDRPHFPLVNHGIAARFSTATLPAENKTRCDVEDLRISGSPSPSFALGSSFAEPSRLILFIFADALVYRSGARLI